MDLRIQLSVLLSLVSLLPLTSALAQSDQDPPTARLVSEDFSPMREAWQPAIGTWSVANGTYGNSSAAGTNITRITEYRRIHPSDPPDFEINYEEFFVRARMRNQGANDTHLVGLIYGYQDSQNYYQVIISATGTVKMRTVMNGFAVDEAPAVQSNIPRNTWFDVQVIRHGVFTEVKLNGATVVQSLPQGELRGGNIGVITDRKSVV